VKRVMFTKELLGLDLPELASALKSVGLDGADLCVRDGYPVSPENIDNKLPKAARYLASEGLSIPMITTPMGFTNADNPHAERIYAACAESGIPVIKVGNWRWSSGQDFATRLEECRSELAGLVEIGRRYQIQTLVHTHSGSIAPNASAVMNLIGGFDPVEVGVMADTGHLSMVGEPIDLALAIIGDRLGALVLKDVVRDRRLMPGRRVVPFGHGYTDWKTALRAMRARGFTGLLNFHSEYRDVPVETVLDFARADVRFVDGLLAAESTESQ
jgi:sugar phosphate isomerase/epimerase